MATLISDMSELAERSQSGSDQVGILRAVDARGLSYVSAAESLSARRRAVGDPLPLRLAPGQVFRTLQEIARAKTAGVPTTAKAICDAARGHSFVPTDPSMTVEQAAALFLAPQPPKERTGQRERLRRELAELSARAFTVHEERQAEALERARLKKEADGDRKRARERDERAAAEKRKEQDQAAADARARAAKIEAFARMSSGKPRTL
jgi:hypothetical protein